MTKTNANAFRVWDSGEQKYMEQSALDNDYDYITIDSRGNLLVFDMYDNPALLSQKHYTIERFTGFTDKNGRDVYEGDLIIDQHREQPHRVFFEESTGCFIAQYKNSLASRNLISAFGKFLEVVGTVHDV